MFYLSARVPLLEIISPIQRYYRAKEGYCRKEIDNGVRMAHSKHNHRLWICNLDLGNCSFGDCLYHTSNPSVVVQGKSQDENKNKGLISLLSVTTERNLRERSIEMSKGTEILISFTCGTVIVTSWLFVFNLPKIVSLLEKIAGG